MTDHKAQVDALFAELARLGLDPLEIPGGGLAGEIGALDGFIAHLRTLTPGATWHDAFPHMPKHWIAGRPETWTSPYHPFGDYDYQDPPGSYAVHVHWKPRDTPERLPPLIAAARAAGWSIYGAGLIPIGNPDWPTTDAMIILERGTSDERCDDFCTWVGEQPGYELAAVPRTPNTQYLDEGPVG